MEKNMEKKKGKAKEKNAKEPVFIVKSATKRGGLDYLHIALIALVIILIAVAFSLSVYKKGVILKNCEFGIVNGSCSSAPYNNSQVIDSAGRILASYSNVNSSLSLLAYYSLINQSKVYYLQNQSGWLVVVPYVDPLLNNRTLNVSFVLNKNLSLESSFLSTLNPTKYTKNQVEAMGVISMHNENICNYTKPVPVYLFIDPYVPGFLSYMNQSFALQQKYGSSTKFNYYFIFSQYSQAFYPQFGASYTQALGRYLVCASGQSRFKQFISNLGTVYNGEPISPSLLNSVVAGSGLNVTQFASCMQSVNSTLFNQAALSSIYNVTYAPSYILNCKYQTIPETITPAIDYALNQINNSK